MREMSDIRNIVILTGAGISAESGIDTFREKGGLWEKYPIEDVATPEAFERNPDLVHHFYDQRRKALLSVKPNKAHQSLGCLDRAWDGNLLIVTQNVDDLHERGGARRIIHMHGELKKALCLSCGMRSLMEGALAHRPPCPVCKASTLRPDVVWFGEVPYKMDKIYQALARADLFVSIGTSGAVYPAAGLVQEARTLGIQTLELNLQKSDGSHWFDSSRLGRATDLVPDWVSEVLRD